MSDSEFFKRLANRPPGNRGGGNDIENLYRGFLQGSFLLLLVAAGFVCYTCFYRVDASDQGVVLRFGEHVRTVDPGLQIKFPWPIESAFTVPVRSVQTAEFGFRTVEAGRSTQYASKNKSMLEIALAHVEWIVQYRISDPYQSLFNVGGDDSGRWESLATLTQSGINPAIPDTIQDVSETIMRKLVGDRSVDSVLTLGREEIAAQAKIEIQDLLNKFEMGVEVVTVKLQTTSPPDSVKDAFQEVNRARQNKERVVNEAEGERNRQIPAARGKQKQMISEAEGYRDRMLMETEGRISAFNAKLAQYEKAPEVTKQRLYLEAMQEVLSNVGDKTIIDESVNQMLPVLNLNRTTDANPLRGSK